MSCAIANSVMDVIRDERLQENAADVGEYLQKKCSQLKTDYDIVGDVRSIGLFVGIELVKNKETREPATEEAHFVVDRMKNVHRILISSDGPDDNVLKLKPPMVFNEQNANEFLLGIHECLHYIQTHEVMYINISFVHFIYINIVN